MSQIKFAYSMRQLFVFGGTAAIMFWLYGLNPAFALLICGSVVIAVFSQVGHQMLALFFLPVPIAFVGYLQQLCWPFWAPNERLLLVTLITTWLFAVTAVSIDLVINAQTSGNVRKKVLLSVVGVAGILGGVLSVLICLSCLAAYGLAIGFGWPRSGLNDAILFHSPILCTAAVLGGFLVGIPAGFIGDLIVSYRRLALHR